MEKLMSMTNRVKYENTIFANREITIEELQILLLKYALFLDQKIELWMFVPAKKVDGVWVVLEKPECSLGNKCASPPCVEYQEAKDSVLFDGFKLALEYNDFIYLDFQAHANNDLLNEDNQLIYDKENEFFGFDSSYCCDQADVIEELILLHLELTPTAKKQIGL